MASSSSSVHHKKYEVFISFRGSDIRQGFLSHLHKALLDQDVKVFVDEQLERGEDISESLLEKIEESYLSVVIFSKDYAYSEWCLQELLKIAECRATTKQIVVPVFYGVDPTHVQDLTGSYGDAMAQHRTKFDESLVEKWGRVLKDTASLSGLVSSNFNTESILIEEIIKHALERLDCLYPSDSDYGDGFVGIGSRVEKIMSLLRGTEDVCVVGIWGEGGVGKTTLARAIFDRIYSQFDSRCFFENVREKSERFTTDDIRNDVVSKLFGTSCLNMSRKRLSRKKIILVLDDVSELNQIKSIMNYKVDVGCGSMIIITSRDSHLLKNLGAKIYAVEKLDRHEALQLFCLNAFSKKIPEEGYLQLSERAVKYAQGLPLALEVLGSNLFQRSAEEWEDELEQLKGTSDKKIHKILRISYEGLSGVEQELFFDIACFFKGRTRHEVERLLDARGSKIGISRLAEKALISIRYEKYIEMHDLIAQMAKDIICEEKTLGKRRWLWDPEDIRFLLTREMGTEAVEGIVLDMSKIGNINVSRTVFQKLHNLRYLHLYSSKHVSAQFNAPEGLEYKPERLRYLYWDSYPSQSLPLTSLLAEKLVELVISNSQLEELWNGVQNLPSLRKLDLSRSKKLIKVPDLSAATNLEELCLGYCESLVEIPSSLKDMSKLATLQLDHCSRLECLPDNLCNLKSLQFLDVSYCENLHGQKQSFGNLNSLVDLFAPDSVCNLKACTLLHAGNLQSLKHLRAGGSGMKEVPSSINKLRELGSAGLILPPLIEFPIDLCSVTSLEHLYLDGNHFESIPECIKHLLKLNTLDISNCEELKYLPESIKSLPELSHLNMRECISLDQNQCSEVMNHFMVEYKQGRRQCIPIGCHPGSEVPEKMTYKNKRGSSLSFSFELLQEVINHKLEFYACVVLDWKIDVLATKVNFMDESGLRAVVEGSFSCSRSGHSTIEWEHVILESSESGREIFVKGRKYAVEFQFLGFRDPSRSNADKDIIDHCSSEGITKCGVFPLFDHQTIE